MAPRLTEEVVQERADRLLELVRTTDPTTRLDTFIKPHDVRLARARIPGFEETWLKAMEDAGRFENKSARAGAASRNYKRINKDFEHRLEVFLKHFAACGSTIEACKATTEECDKTLHPQQVYKRINTSDSDFNLVFYEQYLRAEAGAVFEIEDGIKANARTPTRTHEHGDVNAQKFVLEARHPLYLRRQRIEHDNVHRGSVNLNVIHTDLEVASKEMFAGDVVELGADQVELLE